MDECAEIISHCLSIKEVVHTNQEVPEIQGAFVSRSDDLSERQGAFVSRSDNLSERHMFDRNRVGF